MKKISTLISDAQKKNAEDRVQAESERADAVREIGNIVHESVPVSKTEVGAAIILAPLIVSNLVTSCFLLWFQDDNVTERTFGDCGTRKKYSHVDLVHMVDGFDGERGSKTAGGRGFYLKACLFELTLSCFLL